MPLAIAAVTSAGIGAVASSHASSQAAGAARSAAKANNALQLDIYNKNATNLAPFTQRGNAAGNAYNALLGLGGDTAAANNAFQNYQNSTGYQFRLGQGVNAVNQNAVTNGLLRSGSTLKALNNYGQNMASNEFGNYLGYLGNQQGSGLSAANALAGVGTNYANAVSQNNNAAANATGNAALVGANNINSLLGTGLNALAYNQGNQSSYGGGAGAPSWWNTGINGNNVPNYGYAWGQA